MTTTDLELVRHTGTGAKGQGDVLASASDFAIIVTDRNGQVTEWNSGAEQILGWAADEIIGAPIAQIFTPEDIHAGRPSAEMSAAREFGTANDERWHCRKDGVRFWASGTMQPLVDRNKVHQGYIKLLRDRTESHLAGQALRSSEATLRAVLDALPIAIAIADTNGRIVQDNSAYRASWGAVSGSETANSEAQTPERRLQSGDRIQAQKSALARALDGEVTRGKLAEAEAGNGGQRRFFLNDAAPIRDEAGRIVGGVIAEQDVTAQRDGSRKDALLAAIVSSSSDAMISFAASDGHIMSWNAAAQHLFGYTEAEALGAPVGLLVPPELARQEPTGVFARAMRGERVVEHETTRVAKNGRQIPVTVTAARMLGSEGQVLGVSAIFRDITDRKRLQDHQRASEAKLKRLLDTLDLATVFIRDMDGTISFWSGGCETMFGWTADEVVGHRAHELLGTSYPASRSIVEASLADMGEWQGYLTNRRRDGTVIVNSVRKMVREEDGVLTVMETLTDVTAQRLAEVAVAEGKARLSAMTDAMPQMIWSAGPDGFHDYFNARWYEFTGMPPGCNVGERWRDLIHPEDLTLFDERWRESLEVGRSFEFEYRLRRADGVFRRALARALPARDSSGAITRWFGSSTDIEEIAQAREVLARDRLELERLIEVRTKDLEEALARLAHSQRMEALGQLAGGIAHDFNNVLQAVQGGAGLLQRRCADAAAVSRLARMIGESAERGSSITRRLLSFSRRGDLRAEPVDASAMLDGLREILAHTLGVSISVTVEIEQGLPFLLADRGQLETVLINLATNARDAMPNGGTLSFSADDGAESEERSNRKEAGSLVRLSVRDTGTGMEPDVLARATEPFFTTKAQGQGTGLGLAMAIGFAEQSSGRLCIRSTPGQGTTVTIWLPVAPAVLNGSACLAEPQTTVLLAGKRRLILVDDEYLVRDVLADELRDIGFEVAQASSGEEALSLLDGSADVDLLVTDLSMPGMDGVSLIRETQRRRPQLPVILLTGYAGDAAALAVGREVTGSFSLLRKPVTGQLLAEHIAILTGNAHDALGTT